MGWYWLDGFCWMGFGSWLIFFLRISKVHFDGFVFSLGGFSLKEFITGCLIGRLQIVRF